MASGARTPSGTIGTAAPGLPRGAHQILGRTPRVLCSASRSAARAPQDRSLPGVTAMSSPRATAQTHELAQALVNAFLASSEWTIRPMVDSAATVVGGRRRWLWTLAREVLAGYPRPPLDRPRELAEFIAAGGVVRRAITRSTRAGKPLHAVRVPVVPIRMAARRPWPVPELHGVDDLARLLGLELRHLDWFADVKSLQRRAAPGRLHHYRYSWVIPASGRPRLLEAPLPRLRALQRTLLDEVLAPIPAHPAAHGFVAGRSALTGARLHAGAPVVISLDLASFFAAVGAVRVYGVFRAAGYSQPVAHLLTGLCTTRTPVGVIAGMPAATGHGGHGAQVDARSRLRRLLVSAHLPQGAPTSPALANLCVLGLDRRLTGLAAAAGLTYTRYADDLTFSGELSPAAGARIVAAVDRIARSEGLAVQPAKTRIRRGFQRQEVTGIVVNSHPNLPRTDFDRLRAVLHNAARHGPASQNREAHPDFRAHLLGRIAWATQLNPARGARLHAAFDEIDWPQP